MGFWHVLERGAARRTILTAFSAHARWPDSPAAGIVKGLILEKDVSLVLCLYLIGFILFLSIFSSGLIWGAVLAGVPNIYIVAGAFLMLIIGVAVIRLIGRKKSETTAD